LALVELAKQLGADNSINSRELNRKEIIGEIRETNNGLAADAVLDFVGTPSTSSLGFDLLSRGGRLILLGLFGGEGRFPLPMFPLKGAEVMGNFTGTVQDLAEMVQLVERGTIKPVVSETHPLEKVNEVLGKLVDGKIKGRAVVRP
jgi:propanol-preferring alcohol dehydrogenase